MRGRSSGKTAPPVPGLTRVGGGGTKVYEVGCGLVERNTHVSPNIKPLAGSVKLRGNGTPYAPLTPHRRASPHRAKRNWNSRNLKLYRHGFYYQNLSTIVHGSKAYIANTENDSFYLFITSPIQRTSPIHTGTSPIHTRGCQPYIREGPLHVLSVNA